MISASGKDLWETPRTARSSRDALTMERADLPSMTSIVLRVLFGIRLPLTVIIPHPSRDLVEPLSLEDRPNLLRKRQPLRLPRKDLKPQHRRLQRKDLRRRKVSLRPPKVSLRQPKVPPRRPKVSPQPQRNLKPRLRNRRRLKLRRQVGHLPRIPKTAQPSLHRLRQLPSKDRVGTVPRKVLWLMKRTATSSIDAYPTTREDIHAMNLFAVREQPGMRTLTLVTSRTKWPGVLINPQLPLSSLLRLKPRTAKDQLRLRAKWRPRRNPARRRRHKRVRHRLRPRRLRPCIQRTATTRRMRLCARRKDTIHTRRTVLSSTGAWITTA